VASCTNLTKTFFSNFGSVFVLIFYDKLFKKSNEWQRKRNHMSLTAYEIVLPVAESSPVDILNVCTSFYLS
jgi:hypothetical protein